MTAETGSLIQNASEVLSPAISIPLKNAVGKN
jgi:hypothetical protein